jgi:hypothetical protein
MKAAKKASWDLAIIAIIWFVKNENTSGEFMIGAFA